jgi:hypothetical protein
MAILVLNYAVINLYLIKNKIKKGSIKDKKNKPAKVILT